MKLTAKEFNSLTIRDFKNGAVRDAIYNSLKERESLLEEKKKWQKEAQ